MVMQLLLAVAFLLLPARADMEYSEPMRLQNPPESINKPELKCSVCLIACDAVQHQLLSLKKMTELKIMDSFEKATKLLGEQYGYSDAQGYPEYIQRGKKPVATGLKIRTEFQDQVPLRTRCRCPSSSLPARITITFAAGRSAHRRVRGGDARGEPAHTHCTHRCLVRSQSRWLATALSRDEHRAAEGDLRTPHKALLGGRAAPRLPALRRQSESIAARCGAGGVFVRYTRLTKTIRKCILLCALLLPPPSARRRLQPPAAARRPLPPPAAAARRRLCLLLLLLVRESLRQPAGG